MIPRREKEINFELSRTSWIGWTLPAILIHEILQGVDDNSVALAKMLLTNIVLLLVADDLVVDEVPLVEPDILVEARAVVDGSRLVAVVVPLAGGVELVDGVLGRGEGDGDSAPAAVRDREPTGEDVPAHGNQIQES